MGYQCAKDKLDTLELHVDNWPNCRVLFYPPPSIVSCEGEYYVMGRMDGASVMTFTPEKNRGWINDGLQSCHNRHGIPGQKVMAGLTGTYDGESYIGQLTHSDCWRGDPKISLDL